MKIIEVYSLLAKKTREWFARMKGGCLGRVELSQLGHMDEFLHRICAEFREAQCIRPGNVP